METKVAVAQMLSGADLDLNMRCVRELASQAAKQSAKILVLPENFAMFDSAKLIDLAKSEVRTSFIHNALSTLAEEFGLWIIAGSVPLFLRSIDKVTASCLVFDDKGELVSRYDKIHLFDVDVADKQSSYRESDLFEPGSQLRVVDSPFGVIGLSICYDLRFPEQYQKLRALGAEIIVVPSAFTYLTGQAHWEVLLRARAIENQCYILAANQGGQHSETRTSWGNSMVVDPWGEVLAIKTQSGAGLVLAEIDLAEVHNRRKAMPIMQHRNKAGF